VRFETKGKLSRIDLRRRPFRGFLLVLEEDIIVQHRVAGPAKKMKCAVKQVAGVAIDDAALEPDGKAGKRDRKVQSYLAVLDLMPGRRECAILLKPVARPD
jgi:uncharacterized protein YjbJ (UPF0337 family)